MNSYHARAQGTDGARLESSISYATVHSAWHEFRYHGDMY